MKASELRVGNLVKAKYTNGNPNKWVVIKVKPEHIVTCSDNPKWFKPIPLTEEWILKCGFKDISNRAEKRFIKDSFNWYSSSNEVVVELDNGLNGYDLWTNCKHVHELQNLFFAITGEELQFENVS